MKLWFKDNKLVRDDQGKLVTCPECPCVDSIVAAECCGDVELPGAIDVDITASSCAGVNGTYRLLGGTSIEDALGVSTCGFRFGSTPPISGGWFGEYEGVPGVVCGSGHIYQLGLALVCYRPFGIYFWEFYYWFCRMDLDPPNFGPWGRWPFNGNLNPTVHCSPFAVTGLPRTLSPEINTDCAECSVVGVLPATWISVNSITVP